MVAAAVALAAAGMVTSAMGSARASHNVRMIGKMNADLIKWETAINVAKLRKEARALLGAQKQAYAKGGVLTTEGTAADVIRDTAVQSESDALAMRYAGIMRARLAKMGASAEAENIKWGAISNAFSGAGSMFAMGGKK